MNFIFEVHEFQIFRQVLHLDNALVQLIFLHVSTCLVLPVGGLLAIQRFNILIERLLQTSLLQFFSFISWGIFSYKAWIVSRWLSDFDRLSCNWVSKVLKNEVHWIWEYLVIFNTISSNFLLPNFRHMKPRVHSWKPCADPCKPYMIHCTRVLTGLTPIVYREDM